MREDKIVVVMKNRVHIYRLSDLDFLGHVDTYDNPKGIVALSSTTETFVLAVLSEGNPNDAQV